MASYWIVVPRGNQELFDLLAIAFQGHSGFSVIVDRRGAEGPAHDGDRRGGSSELGPDEIIVAEQMQRRDRQPRGAHESRTPVRVPARRRTSRQSAASDHRLLTL
ncbi:MAG TPA: hypothetical protein VFJ02_21200 [Vicinamibacterales bacterium]|nr:hypothetical protein [Vicinamibacterales bacterium]